jgi:hypothetical protein
MILASGIASEITELYALETLPISFVPAQLSAIPLVHITAR